MLPPSPFGLASGDSLNLLVFDDGAQFSARQVNIHICAYHNLRRVMDDTAPLHRA